ncbi:MAG: AI-2E family transporter [Clostridiaceae bacterium]
MKKESLLYKLTVANLFIIFILLFTKATILTELIRKLFNVIVLPLIIGLFLYYLINPLKNSFIKKGLSKNLSVILSLIISMLIFYILIFAIYFSLLEQWSYISSKLYILTNKLIEKCTFYYNTTFCKYFDSNLLRGYFIGQFNHYFSRVTSMFKLVFDFGWDLFSNVILILLIVYYLLKADDKFKKSLLSMPFVKSVKRADMIIEKSDEVLSRYITGQATVATFLSIFVFIGYLILNFPGKFFLALSTFILAFIPFLGFFISMIIPYIIAFSISYSMVIKLTLVFMISQTIKGRFIVPLVMSKAMKIHPLTDIFLVIASAAVFGISGAFLAVPVYAIIKVIWASHNISL